MIVIKDKKMKDVKTVFIERLGGILDNLIEKNYTVCRNIAHDLVSFSWNLELDDEVFISEVLETVCSNLEDTFRRYSIPKDVWESMHLDIVDKMKPIVDNYSEKNPATMYNCLKELRYITTLHQLTVWQKYDKPRPRPELSRRVYST